MAEVTVTIDLPPLPDVRAEASVDEQLNMLKAAGYDAEDIYAMIRFVQNNNNGRNIRNWVGREIAKTIQATMAKTRCTYAVARRTVGIQWGFPDADALGNYNRIADAGWLAEYGEKPDRPRVGRA
jgi:hypothetical protein